MVATRTRRPMRTIHRARTSRSNGALMAISAAVIICALGEGGSALTGGGAESTGAAEAPSAETASGIPGNYLSAYQSAASTCSGLDWATLAAVGHVETHHGRLNAKGVSSGENYAGAGGPMQFLSSSYKAIQNKHPDVTGTRYDPESAIKASAHKLCDDGAADGNVSKAIYSYNHSSEYVAQVQQQAAAYRSGSAAS